MSNPRWEREGRLLEGAAAGRYSHQVNVVSDNSAFQCVRCQHIERAKVCSNCGNPWFTGGTSEGGVVGLACMSCRLVKTRWSCQQCGTDNAVVTSFGSLKSGTCFIATAAFESENTPEVVFLRSFRDNTLSKFTVGRCFIYLYQRASPPLASIVSRSQALKGISRFVLRTAIKILRNKVDS